MTFAADDPNNRSAAAGHPGPDEAAPDGDPDAAALRRWHEAVNAADLDAVAALCTVDVAVRGPRGVGHGRQLVRDWLTRSGIRLEPLEPLIGDGGRFVIRERAQWTTAASDPVDTWCVFEVRDALISSIARYDTHVEIPSA